MRLLILGAGHIGERLRLAHPEAIATRRAARDGFVRFDLGDPSTWPNIPAAEAVVWTFPAAPVEVALRFREERIPRSAILIVLGSTSAYRTSETDQWIDESAPLDLTQARVEGEERLRETGATVLHLAGIWDAARDPLRWLTEGRIKNGRKYVNLAHTDDIVAAIEAALLTPRPGERINVSDGEPRRWSEHVERLVASGRLPPTFRLPEADPGVDSKRISNDRLRALLPAGYAFHRFTS